MSRLPDEAIAEFQDLWKSHCNTELPRDQAVIRAHAVFAVLRMILEEPSHRRHRDNSETSPRETSE